MQRLPGIGNPGGIAEGKLYGLDILRRLESDSALVVSEGAVYPLLGRLKALGLVCRECLDPDSGHPRKHDALRATGMHRAQDGGDLDTTCLEHEQSGECVAEGEAGEHGKRGAKQNR
jgi:DNA-binding PadR family transcriptional regulator